MGTGEHGGFGYTSGSGKSSIFKRIWYEGTVTVNGQVRDVSRRVYQRNDIDFEYVDPDSGMTNLELMERGNAPIGNDGMPIQLHHVLQKESGPMAEVREITHEEYHRILHGLASDGSSFRHDERLKKQYENFRRKYWRWRARQYEKGNER